MTQARELTETELDSISGGDGGSRAAKHPAKVTVPDIKLGISYADHQEWAEAV